jgi:hypothetical protein
MNPTVKSTADFDPDPTHFQKPQASSNWIRAATRTRQADPFCCSPVWQLSFHEAFSPNRRLLIRESANNVIAFAEKVFSPELIFLTPIEPNWFFGNPLLGRGSVELFSDTLGDIENEYVSTFPKIVISGIRPNGSLFQSLKEKLGSRFQFNRRSSGIQCSASLEGGLDGFLSRRSGNFRRKHKKLCNRLQRNGISFERHAPGSSAEAKGVFARMLSVELSSWKGIGQCGMAEPPTKKFYDVLMNRLAASNDARVIFAQHEGEDIGFIFGGMAAVTYRGQQFSFDEQWRSQSIGNALQIEQVAWLAEERAHRYDMGPLTGPSMAYKSHWTERNHKIETWVLTKK